MSGLLEADIDLVRWSRRPHPLGPFNPLHALAPPRLSFTPHTSFTPSPYLPAFSICPSLFFFFILKLLVYVFYSHSHASFSLTTSKLFFSFIYPCSCPSSQTISSFSVFFKTTFVSYGSTRPISRVVLATCHALPPTFIPPSLTSYCFSFLFLPPVLFLSTQLRFNLHLHADVTSAGTLSSYPLQLGTFAYSQEILILPSLHHPSVSFLPSCQCLTPPFRFHLYFALLSRLSDWIQYICATTIVHAQYLYTYIHRLLHRNLFYSLAALSLIPIPTETRLQSSGLSGTI